MYHVVVHWSTVSLHSLAIPKWQLSDDVSLESPITVMWLINQLKKDERQARNTDSIYQPAAADVTGEGL